MRSSPAYRLILWTGPKHSGKTAALTELVTRARRERITVTGILAPSVYKSNKLVGFDIIDLWTNRRSVLARRDIQGSEKIGEFVLSKNGLKLGRSVLAPTVGPADLIIVDEYGPLELKGGGWRREVDSLIRRWPGMILLVVRDELVDRVAQLYSQITGQILFCREPDAIDRVIGLLAEKSRDKNSHYQQR